MKKTLALLLAIFMLLPMLAACDTTPAQTDPTDTSDTPATTPSDPTDTSDTEPADPVERDRYDYSYITDRSVWGYDIPWDIDSSLPTYTVYVATTGDDSTADGTEAAPFATLEGARDFVRTLDKTKYSGITVLVKEGIYTQYETLTLSAEDSGTLSCPVTYKGEGEVTFYGGINFTADSFEALDSSAEVVQYFPEESLEHIVQLDLTQFGFTLDDLSAFQNEDDGGFTPLFLNGNELNVARYPNDEWAIVGAGSDFYDPEGRDPNSIGGGDDIKGAVYVIAFDEEHMEEVHSWHDIYDGYVIASLTYLWRDDSSFVTWLSEDEPLMHTQFAGGSEPREGLFFYWSHIPEALDAAGEFYVDDNMVMYLYKTEDHDTGHYTMPVLDGNMVTLEGVENLYIENLGFECTRGDGISGKCNNVTIDGCTVQSVLGDGIAVDGYKNTVQNCYLNSIGGDGIYLKGGNEETLEVSDSIAYNNYITNWSTGGGVMESAIELRGTGLTASHNEAAHAVDYGIGFSGAYIVVEYNHLHDLGRFIDDGGAIHITQTYSGLMRYNYIHDVGYNGTAEANFIGVNGFNFDYQMGGIEAYGNIIQSITGNGFLVCGGRNTYIHDNLFISCYRYAVQYTDNYYNGFITGENSGTYGWGNGFKPNEVYYEKFPYMAEVMDTGDVEDLENGDWWIMPAYSKIERSFVYFDKSNVEEEISKKGPALYRTWPVVDKFSQITPVNEDTELVVYMSIRSGHPTVEEALEAAKDAITLPLEEFYKIGRVTE